MKKYLILISAAVMALSCAKELTDNQEANNGEYKTITFESVVTKTTIAENGEVAWEVGDKISVYYVVDGEVKSADATASDAGKTATFTAQIPQEDNPTEYYAAYPAGSGVLTIVDGTPKFYLNIRNGVCDGTFKSANFAASYTSSDDMSFQFHNAVGMIRLAVPQGGTFTKDGVEYTLSGVYMRGQKEAFNSKNNNGPVEFNPADATFGEPEDLTVGETEYGDGDANINLPKLSAEALNLGYVYLPSLPGTWPTGLCIRYLANFDDVKGGALPAVLSKAQSVSIERGKILTLSDQTANLHMNYYVSSTGEGNGLSADTPMSIAKMQEMFDLTDDGMYGAYALQRVTFNLAPETYTLQSTLNIPKASASYLVTINGAGGQAVLDGNAAANVISVGERVHLYLNNVTIQNGKNPKGAGMRAEWTSSAKDSDCIIDCNNCLFNANIAESAAGGLYITDGAAGGLVRLNACSFTSNKVTAGSGSAIYNISAAAVMLNKCSFNANTGTTGAVCLQSGSSSAYNSRLAANNCTFNVGNNPSGKTYGSNGAGISTTGYNVIANSTIWCSSAIGQRGLLAMGIHKNLGDQSGSAVINCFLHNPGTYKAFWLHGNYYQNISNCIYTGVSENNTPVYTLENSVAFSGSAEGKGTDNKKVNGIQHYAYKWTWTDAYKNGMNTVTVEEVNDAIEAVPQIGSIFMNWLKTIPNSLDTDIYGTSRTPASCPGSYQQTDTPASK